MTLDPKFLNTGPIVSPLIIVSKYHENPPRHIGQETFSNCEWIDKYRYQASACHEIIAPYRYMINAAVKDHLEPLLLKSSPLFTS